MSRDDWTNDEWTTGVVTWTKGPVRLISWDCPACPRKSHTFFPSEGAARGDLLEHLAEHAGDEGPRVGLLHSEPSIGSVVLTEGPHGTAWQRFASDGRWHSTTGKSTTWERLIRADRPGARMILAYNAPPRP